MAGASLYVGREATKIKHFVLEKYLERLAYKKGGAGGTLNYVDGFAGPWRQEAEDLSDTSPHIALTQLRAARSGLVRAQRMPPTIRCLFIEKNPESFQKLHEWAQSNQDIHVEVLNGEFEQLIPKVLRFAQEGVKHFTFFFIDPTGWTGFGMEAITPVLRQPDSEVLINFMTKDVKRFIDDESSSALPTFIDLFGRADYRVQWRGLSGQEREDAIVATYCDQVKRAGNYKYVASAVIMHPMYARTHFHLIYGTRNIVGLRVFREVERKAMNEQDQTRAQAQQTAREARSGQLDLFPASEVGSGEYYDQLRKRYMATSQATIRSLIETKRSVPYEEIEEVALALPMTWESDIKSWLKEWQGQRLIRIDALKPRKRTPKANEGHRIVWIQSQ